MARCGRVRRRPAAGPRWRTAGAPVLATLALAALGCGRSTGGEGDAAGAPTAGGRVVSAQVTPVTPSPFVQYVRVVGEVEAAHDVTLSAQESGVVLEILLAKGTPAAPGQPIARIDADVLTAQAEEARALSEVAGERYRRQRRLHEEQRIGSEMELLELRSQADSAAARLRGLEARLERTVVRTPVAGVLDDLFVDVGELVSPGAPVARVVATDQVRIVAGVPERYATALRPGVPALITLDVLGEREFAGVIEFVGASVDQSSRTVPIEILLGNPERLVRPRMVANVRIEHVRLEQAIVVSQDLVQRTEDGFQVFVAESADDATVTARARAVALGPSYADRVVIESGLAAGERLITSGHRQVADGSLIRLVGG